MRGHRFIKSIHLAQRRIRQVMRIDAERNRSVRVPELLTHVGNRSAALQEVCRVNASTRNSHRTMTFCRDDAK